MVNRNRARGVGIGLVRGSTAAEEAAPALAAADGLGGPEYRGQTGGSTSYTLRSRSAQRLRPCEEGIAERVTLGG